MGLCKKTEKWLAANCSHSFSGKTVLITGANSGVGFKMVEILASRGAKVILACRSLQKAEKAVNSIVSEYPNAQLKVMELDIASFDSIRKFASNLKQQKTDIDMFVNNAGVFHHPGEKTADGLELVLGTNYIGVYYLTSLVLPYLQTLGHEVIYVNTISIIHRIGTVDFEDFYFNRNYGNFKVYARSKLCLATYTSAMAEKYSSSKNSSSNIRILMNHPGISITPLGINAFGKVAGFFAKLSSWIFNSPEKSALSAALILSEYYKPGTVIGPDGGLFGGWGYPETNKICKKTQIGSAKLIEFTEKEIEKVNNKT